MFKSIDRKFADIGFIKIKENEYGALYEREVEEFNYTQVLHLIHKKNGRHIIQSYDKNLFDTKKIGNTCVGLSIYEMKLCLKKVKQLGWKPVRF